MPSRRNGFCCWLGGSAPPQISYGLENGGMTLKPIEADIPMPADKQELHDLFAELVVCVICTRGRGGGGGGRGAVNGKEGGMGAVKIQPIFSYNISYAVMK